MQKFALLALFWAASLLVGAQSNSVTIKNGPDFDPKGTITDFIGQKDETIYVLSFRRGPYLGGINANTLASKFETELELPVYNGKEVNFSSVEILDGQLIMLCQYYDKKEDKKILLAQKLDDKGNNDGKYVILDEINAEKKNNSGNFSYTIYSDRGRMLLFTNPPFEKYSKEKFAFKVLDKNLEVVWSEDIELPYPDRFFSVNDFVLDKSDNLYMLCTFDEYAQTQKEEGRRKAKEEAKESGNKYSYKLVSYTPKKGKLKEFEIELEDSKTVLSFSYELDVNDNIYATGLYSDNVQNKKYDGADGIFFVKLDGISGNVKTVNTKPFDKDFMEEYLVALYGERKGEKKAGKGEGIKNFVVRDLINRQDGGALIVGEIYYSYTVCTTDSKGVTRCSTHYIYNYILVVNVNSEGSIDWISYVPKIQHTVNDGGFYSSFAMLNTEDQLIFLFNDNMKNYDPKNTKKKIYQMTSFKKTVTAIATVDNEGKVKREANAKLKADKKILRPKINEYIVTDDKLVVLGKYGKKECVVEVKPK
ncbi:MAG: hypothetical protein ACKVOK_15100 [Flavobacteriales bacterium]